MKIDRSSLPKTRKIPTKTAALKPENTSELSSHTPTERITLTKLRAPDFKSILSDPEANPWEALRESTKACSDWVQQQAPPLNDGQIHFWKGLSEWRAGQALDTHRPEWRGSDASLVTSARTMWNISDIQEAPTDAEQNTLEDNHWATRHIRARTNTVLDMVASFVGKEKLVGTIDSFLEQQNGQPADYRMLFKELRTRDGVDWESVMEGWMEQPHMPKVKSRLSHGGRLHISQEAFKLYPDTPGEFHHQWSIPLQIRYEDSEGVKTHRTVVSKENQTIKLPADGQVKWAYPNAGGKGVYRTSLAARDEEALLSNLDSLNHDEKFALTANQWRLTRHGEAGVGKFLDLMKGFAPSADDNMLRLFNIEASYIGNARVKVEDREGFRKFIRSVFEPAIERLDGDKTSSMHREFTRKFAMGALAVVGSEMALAAADKEFTLDSDVLNAIRQKPEAFSKALEELPGAKGQDAWKWAHTLAYSQDPEVIGRTLEIVDGLESNAHQDAVYGIVANSSDRARDTAWKRLQSEWREVPNFESWLKGLAHSPHRDKLHQLAQSKEDSATLELLDKEIFRGEVKWMPTVADDVGAWLSENGFTEHKSSAQEYLIAN